MNDIVPAPSLAPAPDQRYMRMTAEQLMAAFREACASATRSVEEMGRMAYAAKCRRDETVYEEMRRIFGMFLDRLVKIGSGQVLAALYRAFGMHPIFSILARLDLEEQRRLAEDGAGVPVLVYLPEGGPTLRQKDPRLLSREEVKQAFDGGRIRTQAEQQAWLDRQNREARKTRPEKVGDITIDRVTKTITVPRRMTLSADQLKTFLKVLGEKP